MTKGAAHFRALGVGHRLRLSPIWATIFESQWASRQRKEGWPRRGSQPPGNTQGSALLGSAVIQEDVVQLGSPSPNTDLGQSRGTNKQEQTTRRFGDCAAV
jgi:hypothetical protein